LQPPDPQRAALELAMNNFCVWISPLADVCKVRVLGIKNAEWLLNRLRQSLAFRGSEAVNDKECFPCCSFIVPYTSQTSPSTLEKLLSGIWEVKLMLNLA
jgi:hypothetical protein